MSGTFFGLLVAAIFISISTEKIKKESAKKRREQALKNSLDVKVELTPPQELKKVEKPDILKEKKTKKKKND